MRLSLYRCSVRSKSAVCDQRIVSERSKFELSALLAKQSMNSNIIGGVEMGYHSCHQGALCDFLLQRISVTIQRGSADSLFGTAGILWHCRQFQYQRQYYLIYSVILAEYCDGDIIFVIRQYID
jgi:hypothetical protein